MPPQARFEKRNHHTVREAQIRNEEALIAAEECLQRSDASGSARNPVIVKLRQNTLIISVFSRKQYG